jgi:hypothetical protein
MKLTVDYHSVVSFYFNPLSNFSSINNSTRRRRMYVFVCVVVGCCVV